MLSRDTTVLSRDGQVDRERGCSHCAAGRADLVGRNEDLDRVTLFYSCRDCGSVTRVVVEDSGLQPTNRPDRGFALLDALLWVAMAGMISAATLISLGYAGI